MGGRLKREGMYVYLELIHVVVQQKPTQHYKAIIIQFVFLGFKITVNGDYSHESKRRLLLRRKAMTNLDSIL